MCSKRKWAFFLQWVWVTKMSFFSLFDGLFLFCLLCAQYCSFVLGSAKEIKMRSVGKSERCFFAVLGPLNSAITLIA